MRAFSHCIISPHQLTATTINLSIIIPHKSPNSNARNISKKCRENVKKDYSLFKPPLHHLDRYTISFNTTSTPIQSSLPLPSISTFPLWKTDLPEDALSDAFSLSHPASHKPPHEPDMPLCLIFQVSTKVDIALYDSLSYNSAKANRIFQPVPRADPPANPPQDTTVRLFPHTIFPINLLVSSTPLRSISLSSDNQKHVELEYELISDFVGYIHKKNSLPECEHS